MTFPRRRARFLTPLVRATGRARGDALRYLLSSESECRVVFRTCCWFPVVLRGRPGTSACSSAGVPTHVETRSPPYVRSVGGAGLQPGSAYPKCSFAQRDRVFSARSI